MKKISNVLGMLSLTTAMLLTTGCGSSSDTSTVATDSGTSATTTITVERGRVLNATVTDAAGQIGRQNGNGQYTFDNTPTYPVSVTGGIIDVNNNGVIDAGEPFLTLPMEAYEGDKVTLVTTLIADADKTVRDDKLAALQTALETELGETVDVNSLLELPTQNTQVAVLSNELYEAVLTGEISSINDVNLTEMTTLLTGAQFIVDFDTTLAAIAADVNLSSATAEELAVFLEEEKVSDLAGVIETPTQTELDILSAPYTLTEAMISNKAIDTIILEKMTTPWMSSGFSTSFYSDKITSLVDPSGDTNTWSIKDGSLYISYGSYPSQIKITFAAAPDANNNFQALFEYIDIDGNVFNDYGTFFIGDASNRLPTALAQSVTVLQDSLTNTITLSGEDVDGDSLTYSIVTNPTNGTISGTAPNLTYTPNSNFNGTDSFTFEVFDGTDYSAEATVNITVNYVFTNTAPVASTQTVSVDQNSVNNVITLSGTDFDQDALTYTIVGYPSAMEGTLAGTPPNVTFTPAEGYYGDTSFTFQVNDGTDDSAVATVSIAINQAFTFGTVTSPFTGRVWMDRNLGASKVCETPSEAACYGDYYQWGRDADGHQEYNSTVTTDQAIEIDNVGSSLIETGYFGDDWTLADADKTLRSAKWAAIDGSSVCPVGFRVPTTAEMQAELVDVTAFDDTNMVENNIDANTNSLATNFLKLPVAGSREYGDYYYQGEASVTWTTDIVEITDGSGNTIFEGGAYYVDWNLNMEFSSSRAENIRCIQD